MNIYEAYATLTQRRSIPQVTIKCRGNVYQFDTHSIAQYISFDGRNEVEIDIPIDIFKYIDRWLKSENNIFSDLPLNEYVVCRELLQRYGFNELALMIPKPKGVCSLI